MTVKTIDQPEFRVSQASQAATRRPYTRWLPSLLWLLAAALLLISVAFPYWGMVLHAPQYPGGLQMRVFVNRMTGDPDPALDEVREIDNLNHYIGMRSLYEAAQLERNVAIPAIVALVALLVIAAVWRRRWVWMLTFPGVLFPLVFLGDLAFWLHQFGQNLDPAAPLSSAIRPFTPPVLGEGTIGQFKTVAYVDTGWYIAIAAAALIVVAAIVTIWLSRKQGATGGTAYA